MFGRKKVADDDPFAALKQGGTYQSQPTTTVAGIPGSGLEEEPTEVATSAPIPVAPPAPTPAAAPPPGPTPTATPPPAPTPTSTAPPAGTGSSQSTRRPYRVTRRSGRSALVIRLIVLGVLAAIAIPIISSATHAIHSFSVPSFTVPNFNTPTTTQPKGPKPPRPTNYLKAAGLRTGLRRIVRQFPGARVSNLRVDNNSLDALMFPRHGGVKDLHLSAGGMLVTSTSSPGEKPIAIAAIPVGAVPRIVTAMRRQFHIPPSRIDYIVLSAPPNLPVQWIAFAKNKAHTGYAAGLDGTGLHKLG